MNQLPALERTDHPQPIVCRTECGIRRRMGGDPVIAQSAVFGGPRPMRMGTIPTPSHYDRAADCRKFSPIGSHRRNSLFAVFVVIAVVQQFATFLEACRLTSIA
jgi:hypothetical protein